MSSSQGISNNSFYAKYVKRGLDVLLSCIALLLFWWLLAIIALLARLKLGSPVLFKQERPGKGEKIFRLYKFRSMNDARDAKGRLLPDEERLTHFGKLLRSTSLDELPELFNIFKGDMSIIGPRPLLVRYIPLYSPEQHRRHEVRPGLTGLAQVHGRNLVDWDERFKYDVEYVDHCSFAMDIKILVLTVKAVLFREGITSESSATMEEFTGTRRDGDAAQ